MNIFIIYILRTNIVLTTTQPQVTLLEVMIVLGVCDQYPGSDIEFPTCVLGWPLYVPRLGVRGRAFGGQFYTSVLKIYQILSPPPSGCYCLRRHFDSVGTCLGN